MKPFIQAVILLALTGTLAPATTAFAQEDQFPEGVAVGWIKDGAPGALDQTRPRQSPGQTLPIRPTRKIDFTTTEGTWMSLDVSPDGKTMIFDMLGDIYALDTSGGAARPLRTGLPFDTQPVFSPDGRQIAFISDASGADNLWVMQLDGSNAHQVSFGEDDTVLLSPEWAPDGQSVFLERYRPSYNAFELWNYSLNDTETLVVPVKAAADQGRGDWLSTLGAVPTRDGKAIYLARHVGPTDPDQRDEWTIIRRDLASGTETTIVHEPDGSGKSRSPGAFFRPALSPDGRYLAYATRLDNQTGLRLRDLTTGQDSWLASPITHDQLQANAWLDLLPRYSFTPDSRAILITAGGKFERVDIATRKTTPIPFTADVHLALGALSRQHVVEETGPVKAHLIQTPEMSPDGSRVAFSALGRLYVMALDGKGAPRRIMTGDQPVFQPSWSPDGKILTYISWSADKAGDVFTVRADGAAAPIRISTQSDYYTYPVFTPDGGEILAQRSSQQDRLRLYMEYGPLRMAQLVNFPATGGPATAVGDPQSMGQRPTFSPDPDSVYLQTGDGVTAMNLKTGKTKAVIAVNGPGWYFQDGPVPVDTVRLSPDGKWVAAIIAQQLHIVEMPADGHPIDLADPHLRHRRITDVGADFLEWSKDGKTITYALGSTFYERPLSSIAFNAADKPGWDADAQGARAFKADITVPRDVSHGVLLLRGATALPMDVPAIADADILIEDNRIAAIGPKGSLNLPAGPVIRDETGKFITPGFVDTHDHIGTVRRDVLDESDWSLRERLAYGVTTSFDPSTLSIDMVAYRDMLDAGMMTGPRLPSTGTAIFSFNKFSSLDEVEKVLSRYRDDYGLHNIKEYRTGDRKVREWVNMACLDLGLQPTTEGALSLKLDLSQVMDGFSGNEHALVAFPIYNDVIQLMAQSHTSYTTTLQITNGGATGQNYFLSRESPSEDPKYQHFTPRFALDQMTTRLDQWMPLSQYLFPTVAKGAHDIRQAGGLVGIGAHGNTPGVGFHYELEAHVLGGWSPEEALRAGTLGSAETIGRIHDIGSLTPGKFADLVILNADPRLDIKNTWKIDQVMKNGRLYDAATLDQIWPDIKPAKTPWFAAEMRSGDIK